MIFNTLQELWSYSLYCPICKDVCRDIYISADTTQGYQESEKYEKQDHTLKITILKTSIIKINCLTNKYECESGSTPNSIFIDSSCNKCEYSTANSCELCFNTSNNEVSNIAIDSSCFIVNYKKEEFLINPHYTRNVLIIDDLSKQSFPQFEFPLFEFPLFDIDLSNKKKLIHKLKTILTFG
jgi:hypothetical protein